jgi:site-specific recombinase XerD
MRHTKPRPIFKVDFSEKSDDPLDVAFRHCQIEERDAFGESEGVRCLNQLDVRLLRKFRATWKDRNLAALKKLERLRSFYRFAVSNKWVENNVAKEVKKPLIEDRQTLPYSSEESASRFFSAIQA